MDENGNEIPAQIGLVTVLFDTKTVHEDLLVQTPNACISSNTNIWTGLASKKNGICKYCSASGNYLPCFARKYVAYCSDKMASICHIGDHTCFPKDIHKRTPDVVKSALSVSSAIKPSEIQSMAILSDLKSRKDWKVVEKTAKNNIKWKDKAEKQNPTKWRRSCCC